jgi:hypothetical protein
MSLLDSVFGINSIFSRGTAVATRKKLNAVGGLVAVDDSSNARTNFVLKCVLSTDLASLRGVYDGEEIHVEGYSARGDDGGGSFVWDDDSNVTPVAGVICGTGPGQWIRRRKGGVWDPAWLGAPTTGDATAALQAALDTGNDLDLQGRTYYAHELTMSTNFQRIVSTGGKGRIIKNANGVLLTVSGNDCGLENIEIRGDASTPVYTGANIHNTGDRFELQNVNSLYAYAEALISAGETQIYGGKYQTADAGAGAYDIVIGKTSAQTLYHIISGTRSNQHAGGIKLLNCGTSTIQGCQFGKLLLDDDGAGTGASGNKIIANRIHDDITVDQSNTVIVGNILGSLCAVTFNASTSNCRYALNVEDAATTITNNGNQNNLILRERSTGSTNDIGLGDDADSWRMTCDPSGHTKFASHVTVPNNRSFRSFLQDGTTLADIAQIGATDNLTIGAGISGTTGYGALNGGSGGVYQVVSGTSRTFVNATEFRPNPDNTLKLGHASYRWTEVFAANATINTSDERLKAEISCIDPRVLKAWGKVEFCQYKMRDAVEVKGSDGARWHFGVIAQRVIEAFKSEGLDAFAYGLVCHDSWDAQTIPAQMDGDRVVMAEQHSPSGDRYGIRYEEALALECAYLRSRLEDR